MESDNIRKTSIETESNEMKIKSSIENQEIGNIASVAPKTCEEEKSQKDIQDETDIQVENDDDGEPEMWSQQEMNDLVKDLKLEKDKAKILFLEFKRRGMLEKGVKLSKVNFN